MYENTSWSQVDADVVTFAVAALNDSSSLVIRTFLLELGGIVEDEAANTTAAAAAISD